MSTLILAIVALVVNVAVLVFVLKARKHSRQMEVERQRIEAVVDRELGGLLDKLKERP